MKQGNITDSSICVSKDVLDVPLDFPIRYPVRSFGAIKLLSFSTNNIFGVMPNLSEGYEDSITFLGSQL